MKKRLFLLPIAGGLLLASCSFQVAGNDISFKLPWEKGNATIIDYDFNGYSIKQLVTGKVTVSFYYNYGKEEINLNSGMYASGTSTALKVDEIDKNTKVSRPDTDPVRKNYDFAGWHTDAVVDSPFDFDSVVTKNLVLYAHWSQTQEEEFIEPEYVEPSHIDDSIDTLVSITGVLNMPIVDGKVKLSNSAISRLNRNPENIVDVLNYKIKTGVELSASYSDVQNQITFNATKDNDSQSGSFIVVNNSANLVIDNGTYETKAKNYETEGIDIEDHRIMLAGSSSMENWKDSTSDLQPLTTYNHGIGGTTVEQWGEKLNQRLVYPYSPKIVVYYVGVNNIINTGSSVEFTGSKLVEMFDDVHEHLPNTHIYYVLINKLPGFVSKQPQLDAVNQYALDYEASHDYVTTLDAGQGLIKSNGQPNQAYFLVDGLHMSLAGYAIWGKFIKDKLISDLRNA